MEFGSCSKKLRVEKDCDAKEGQEDGLELSVDGSEHTRKEAEIFLYGVRPIPHVKVPPPGVVFVFEMASLVHAQVGKSEQILNSDVHSVFLRKKNLNPADYRPDIIHEVLVSLYHSRLNLSGRMKGVYIKTNDGKQTLVFVVGAMAHGKFDDDYTHDLISVSDMPLTAAKCVGKICYELDRRDKVL